MTRAIAILGASGFIGKRLVSELLRDGSFNIRVLTRDKQRDLREENFGQGVEILEGDVRDSESLRRLLVPGCVVINLVYFWGAGETENLACIHALLDACRESKVARLIHCSTAGVMGRVAADLVDENDRSHPVDEYGSTKLKIDEAVLNFPRDGFDVVIVRPTSVFGIEGIALKKLVEDLTGGNHGKNYFRSCLFGNRRMNLVPVVNVTAAIIYLAGYDGRFDGEVFIISDDDDPKNNFSDVERFMMNALGVRAYLFPKLPVPLIAIKLLLLLMGRNTINPLRNFDPRKLRALGFKPPLTLAGGLAEYAAWYRQTVLENKAPKNS